MSLNTTLRALTLFGDALRVGRDGEGGLPESLLDSLLLLQSFTLVAQNLESLPEHLLHGSTLFRSLNLKQGVRDRCILSFSSGLCVTSGHLCPVILAEIPEEMWALLHSMASTRHLRAVSLSGVRRVPPGLFQYIPYLESVSIRRGDPAGLHPRLFQRLVRLNELSLAGVFRKFPRRLVWCQLDDVSM